MTVLVKINQIIALVMAHKQVAHANVLISVFSLILQVLQEPIDNQRSVYPENS